MRNINKLSVIPSTVVSKKNGIGFADKSSFVMTLLEKDLFVKRSRIPGSGKGLFTKVDIPKGTRIVEYKGKITDWKNVNHKDGRNPYIFFVTRNHVIDALRHKSALARYANDARGLTKVAGINNNCEYVTARDKRVYIRAIKNIPAGSEILVAYGKEYWDVIKETLQEQ